LASVGLKLGDWDTNRQTTSATVAVWAVGEDAAPPKARPNQLGIDLGLNQVARRSNLRPRQTIRQVAAGIGRRRIKLQR